MPTTYIPTSAQDVLTNAYFIEEQLATPGVTPTNGTWKSVGLISNIDEVSTHEEQEIPIVGSADYFANLKMGNTKTFNMTYYIINNTEFCRYLNELAAGTGTPAHGLSVLQKQNIDGAPMYRLYRGCFPATGTFNIGRMISIDMTFRAMKYTEWVDQAAITAIIGASPIYPGALTGTPITNLSTGTLDPFTIGGVPFDLQTMTMDVNRNPRELKPLGNSDPTKLGVGNRRFTGALTTWVAGNDIYDFHDTFTPNSLVFRFRTMPTPIDLTLSNVTFGEYRRPLDAGSNEFQTESVNYKAGSATISLVTT